MMVSSIAPMLARLSRRRISCPSRSPRTSVGTGGVSPATMSARRRLSQSRYSVCKRSSSARCSSPNSVMAPISARRLRISLDRSSKVCKSVMVVYPLIVWFREMLTYHYMLPVKLSAMYFCHASRSGLGLAFSAAVLAIWQPLHSVWQLDASNGAPERSRGVIWSTSSIPALWQARHRHESASRMVNRNAFHRLAFGMLPFRQLTRPAPTNGPQTLRGCGCERLRPT